MFHTHWFAAILLVSLTSLQPATAQWSWYPTSEKEKLEEREVRRYLAQRNAAPRPRADNTIDVIYYKLNLTITTSPDFLRGIVTVKARSAVSNLSTIRLDLTNSLSVDSVKVETSAATFIQDSATVSVTLPRTYASGEMVTAEIYYGGTPLPSGFGSFVFDQHSGTPWVWTLSEPYGARDWWPCKDHPLDKADSVDIWITCTALFKVGSNGKLAAVVDNGNGTKTWHWAVRHPIATYLVMIALTNYAEFSNWFRYSPTDSMQVLNYVIPEHLAEAQALFPLAVDMLRIYSERFGLYPFIDEKFGHAEFARGGGMEHQTMTSIQNFNETNIAHELSHQWFGDCITPASWQHLWLNEGFAVYSEALYYEAKDGPPHYWSDMQAKLALAKNAVGPLFAQDTINIRVLFDHNRVYMKGAVVLHMLRHVLGDSTFFRCLRAYTADPLLRFRTATTEDFQRVCETVSGRPLSYFFNEWIYGERYPAYSYSWQTSPAPTGSNVALRVSQITGTTNPGFFTMPIDVKLSAPGWDTTVTLFNNAQIQQFTVYVSRLPTSCQLDPENWILRDVTELSAVAHEAALTPADFRLDQNYPNPFNPSTAITFALPASSGRGTTGDKESVSLQVLSVLGGEVATIVNGELPPGMYTVRWNADGLPSGTYFYRLRSGGNVLTKKMLLLR